MRQRKLRTSNYHGPQRSCLVCRRREHQNELCRLAVVGEQLVYDASRRLPGRGYYLCRRSDCLQSFLAGKRRPGRLPLGAQALTGDSRRILEAFAHCDVN